MIHLQTAPTLKNPLFMGRSNTQIHLQKTATVKTEQLLASHAQFICKLDSLQK